MVYRPLDLSFLSNQYAPNRNNIHEAARQILANAQWGPEKTFAQIAAEKKAQDAYAAKHKGSAINGFFDLLSTPLYGLANALDEAIAGHQSSNNDSVLHDIGQTVGGLFTGAARGVGAGLRGSTQLLDALPGININDDWQTNPKDKTDFGDVNIRLTSKMSAADAMKPENWAKVKKNVAKEKSELNAVPWLRDMFYPDLNSPDARKSYFKHMMLLGLGEDIAGDPLNYVSFGGSSLLKSPKILKGIKDALSSTELKGIGKGLNAANEIDKGGKVANDLNSMSNVFARIFPEKPVKSIPEISDVIPSGGADVHVTGVDPATLDILKSVKKFREKPTGPKSGIRVPHKDQKRLVQRITGMAAQHEKGWMYRAANLLGEHSNVDWRNTEHFLQVAGEIASKRGGLGNPKEFSQVLRKRIAQDVETAGPASNDVAKADQLVNHIKHVFHHGSPILRRKYAVIANDVIKHYGKQVLGEGNFAGMHSPGAYKNALASGKTFKYSGPKQANMWNDVEKAIPRRNPKRFERTVETLRAIEDYFMSRGARPYSSARASESIPLRLSDVAQVIGPKILGKSHAFITGVLRGDEKALSQLPLESRQALEMLKAKEAMTVAPAITTGIGATKDFAERLATRTQSQARLETELKNVPKVADILTARLGGGEVGSHVAKEAVKEALGKTSPVEHTFTSKRFKTEAWLSNAAKIGEKVNDIDFVNSVTKAIEHVTELPAPRTLGKLAGPAAHVYDWLGARFNAAYGVKDMRPIFLERHSHALTNAAMRSHLFNDLAKTFSPKNRDLWHEAMRTAQMNGIAEGQVGELTKHILAAMENLVGGSGLRNGALADSTVAGRARLYMQELNRHMRRFGLGEYQFIAKKIKNKLGEEHDYSQGADWLKSWETWEIKDPYTFLHRFQNAVESTVHEKAMFDEIVTRFASPKRYKDVKYGVSHPRLQGFFFNEEGARQAQVFIKALKELNTPNPKSLQYIDHVLSKFKAAVTIYMPGHHLTNLIGDTYYNWIAGVNKPIRYEQAMKVMASQKGRYGNFFDFTKISSPDALKQAVARSLVKADAGLELPATGNKVILTMKNGTKVTADMIYTAALHKGVLPLAKVLEDVTSDATSILDKFRPLGGKGQQAVHKISEIRDHVPRIAQFIDVLAKSDHSFATAIDHAAHQVRKWHPDGLDTTNFERQFMKRIFPFYSWTRKAIPLAIESSLIAAPKVMAYPRLMEALALAAGVPPGTSLSDPFPNDQMFPDWIRQRGIGPIWGSPGNYRVVNPSTPVLDMISLLGNPGTQLLENLNPMVKVPLETANGETLGTNIPIKSYPNYLSKQIPVVSNIGRGSGMFGVSDTTKAQGFPNWQNLFNMATGAKTYNTGQYQKSAQFDLRDYFRKKQQQQFRG